MLNRLALTLGALLLASTAAHASCTTAPGSNDCVPNVVLVNPATGAPYAASGGGSGGGGSVTQGTSPWVDNISQFGGSAVQTGTGASGAGIPRVTVSNDSVVAISALPALPAGTNQIGNTGGLETNGSAVTGNGNRMMGSDGTNARDLATTVNGQLQPPTGTPASTITSLSANTSTQIAAANASRIAFHVACSSGGVVISESAASLTSYAFGASGQTAYIPATAYAQYTPEVATRGAITAGSATAQTCVVTEWNR